MPRQFATLALALAPLAAAAQTGEPRLAVFEYFSRFTGGNCLAAGPVVDRLAEEMADRPVVFLEMNYDGQVGNRVSRWWFAYPGGTPFLPLVMVGSGREIADGLMDFERVFRGMVEREMAVPPQASLRAWWARQGNRMRIYTRLTNRLAVPLSAAQQASVHALVWEDRRVGTTNRIIRDAPNADINPALAAGATADLPALLTRELTEVNWSKVHATVLVEWRPPGQGAFDQLQAAIAVPAGIAAAPAALSFRVNALNPPTSRGPLALDGPGGTPWSASADALWLRVVPAAGTLPATVQVEIIPELLPEGPQQALLTFGAASPDGWNAVTTVNVDAELTPPFRPVRRLLRR